MPDDLAPIGGSNVPEAVRWALARTPARVLVGRAGPGYRTADWLALRQDHAAARDAVRAELDLARDFPAEQVKRWQLFEARSAARSKAEFLLRPDLGRRFDGPSRELIRANCPPGPGLQIIIGDGLSATAVASQAPPLLDRIGELAAGCGWRLGRPFVVRYCRVGLMNEVGELLGPEVVVLLIGERPGLATAESLSAYLAYRPRPGHTDADRNLISNIHPRGVATSEAAGRILSLAGQFREGGRSGVAIKEVPASPGLAEITGSSRNSPFHQPGLGENAE